MREKSHARGLTASYLEPDRRDDEEDTLEQSLLEIKRKYKKGLAKGIVQAAIFLVLLLYIP